MTQNINSMKKIENESTKLYKNIYHKINKLFPDKNIFFHSNIWNALLNIHFNQGLGYRGVVVIFHYAIITMKYFLTLRNEFLAYYY